MRDYVKLAEGRDLSFTDVQAFLAERGIGISRARWSYLINEHREVDDPQLIVGFAELFDVPVSFLIDGEPVPEKLTERLDELRDMRADEVLTFAARSLGGIDPDMMAEIARVLDTGTSAPGEV